MTFENRSRVRPDFVDVDDYRIILAPGQILVSTAARVEQVGYDVALNGGPTRRDERGDVQTTADERTIMKRRSLSGVD